MDCNVSNCEIGVFRQYDVFSPTPKHLEKTKASGCAGVSRRSVANERVARGKTEPVISASILRNAAWQHSGSGSPSSAWNCTWS